MFNTSTEKDCFSGLAIDEANRCKTVNKHLFRTETTEVSLLNAVRFSVTVGMSRVVDVVFNKDEFDNAVQEASHNSNIEAVLKTNEELFEKLSSLKDTYNIKKARYNERLKVINKKVAIIDKSGFIKSDRKFKKSELKNFINVEHSIDGFIPKEGIKDINTIAQWQNVEKPLVALEKYYNEKIHFLDTFHANCRATRYHGYNISFKCPTSVPTTNTTLNARVTILSHDFNGVLPQKVSIKHDAINGVFNGKVLELSNPTNNFVYVDKVTMYYQDKVLTKEIKRDYPPMSKDTYLTTISLSELNFKPEWTSYSNATERRYKGKMLKFGFAIKYKVIDTNKEYTFFQQKKDPIVALMKNSL